MVTRPEVAVDAGGFRGAGERLAREDVVQPPPDIPFLELAPRRPPREEGLVAGVERASGVDEPLGEDLHEERALVWAPAQRPGLPLFRVHVAVRERDVHVATQEQRALLCARGRRAA